MPLIDTETSPEKIAALRIKQLSAQGFQNLFAQWQASVSAIWRAKNPQAVVDALGKDAGNGFKASVATASFLAEFSSLAFTPEQHGKNLAQIVAVANLAKPYTIKNDGTVAINSSTP